MSAPSAVRALTCIRKQHSALLTIARQAGGLARCRPTPALAAVQSDLIKRAIIPSNKKTRYRRSLISSNLVIKNWSVPIITVVRERHRPRKSVSCSGGISGCKSDRCLSLHRGGVTIVTLGRPNSVTQVLFMAAPKQNFVPWYSRRRFALSTTAVASYRASGLLAPHKALVPPSRRADARSIRDQ